MKIIINCSSSAICNRTVSDKLTINGWVLLMNLFIYLLIDFTNVKNTSFHKLPGGCWPIMVNIILKSTMKCQLPTQLLHLPPLKLEFPIGNTIVSFTIVVQYLLMLLTPVWPHCQISVWLLLHTKGSSCVSDGLSYQREHWVGASLEFLWMLKQPWPLLVTDWLTVWLWLILTWNYCVGEWWTGLLTSIIVKWWNLYWA